MLTFDHSKIRSEQVYLSRVTDSFVYVRYNVDKTPYEHPSAVSGRYRDRAVQKVPFPDGFSQEFIRQNYLREFSRAKRACLVWYGDTLIHVEVERGRKPDAEGPWVSHIEASLAALPGVLPSDQPVYYDGQYLFWLRGVDSDLESEARLDPQGRFSLAPCECLSMSNLGIKTNLKASRARRGATSGDANNPETSAVLHRMVRSVLLFRPFAGSPDRKQYSDLTAVSPVLERSAMQGRISEGSRFDDRRALYRMGHPETPVHGSLEFVMKAADVVGSIYGHEAVDFLDLPKIIAATGEVNLHRIEKEDRQAMPIQHRAEDCIAWLMGFIHREQNLVNQRKLTGMFRYVLRHGLVDQIDVDNIRRPEHANEAIPVKSFRGADRLVLPAPF